MGVQRTPRAVAAAGVQLLIPVGLAVLAAVAYAAGRIWAVGQEEDLRPSSAIVVLGAAQYDGRPSPVFQARLDHALALWQAGWAPRIVVTGGRRPGDRWTEAGAARQYLTARGVPASAILAEDRGRSTLESLTGVAALCRTAGCGDLIVVSDRVHMLRVLRIARDLGLVAHPSPAPASPTDIDPARRLPALVHELGALFLYFVTGGAPPDENLASGSADAAPTTIATVVSPAPPGTGAVPDPWTVAPADLPGPPPPGTGGAPDPRSPALAEARPFSSVASSIWDASHASPLAGRGSLPILAPMSPPELVGRARPRR